MSFASTFVKNENVLIVRLSGELDHHAATLFRQKWQENLQSNRIKHVILNFSDVSFMDSSGIGVVLGRYKEIVLHGGELVVCSVNESLQRIFEMAGLYKIIRAETNEKYALLSLGVAAS